MVCTIPDFGAKHALFWDGNSFFVVFDVGTVIAM
jgi:hypothetical protein